MEPITNEAVLEQKSAPAGGGKRLRKGGNRPLIVIGVLVAVAVAAYLGLCAYAGNLNTFYPNYRINGI